MKERAQNKRKKLYHIIYYEFRFLLKKNLKITHLPCSQSINWELLPIIEFHERNRRHFCGIFRLWELSNGYLYTTPEMPTKLSGKIRSRWHVGSNYKLTRCVNSTHVTLRQISISLSLSHKKIPIERSTISDRCVFLVKYRTGFRIIICYDLNPNYVGTYFGHC